MKQAINEMPQLDGKPKRRWVTYSLRQLLALVAVAAVACSWFGVKMQQARRQKAAVEAIRDLGGHVRYHYEYVKSRDWEGYDPDARPPGPSWFLNFVGVDFLSDVRRVELTGPRVTDAHVEHVSGLTRLKELKLSDTQISDGGLAQLKKLTDLEMQAGASRPFASGKS